MQQKHKTDDAGKCLRNYKTLDLSEKIVRSKQATSDTSTFQRNAMISGQALSPFMI